MEFIELIKAAALGVIQGITEWLPVSSTGHMILADEFIRMNVSDAFFEMFLVVIQFGSILAVLTLYFNRLNPFARNKTKRQREDTYRLWLNVILAGVPAGIVGILFNDKIDEIFYNYFVVALALIIYGVLFILIEREKNRGVKISSLDQMDYKTALLIGCFQTLALIPGTSRSGSTILSAMLVGTARPVAAEFSFFLAIPMMAGASLIKLYSFGFSFTQAELAVLLTGMAVAYIVSILAIRFLMGYIRRHDFQAFGWYRIALGAVVLAYFMLV